MKFKLDPYSVVITAIIMPLVYVAAKRIRKFTKENANKIMDALLWFAARAFNRNLSQKASLRQYCRNGLARSVTRYMLIPGKTQVTLETDSTFISLRLKTAGRLETYQGELTMLSDSSRVQIIGDPGSGKSSLVKKMFRGYCHLGRMGLTSEEIWRLPVLIELKNLVPPKRISTSDSLGKWALQEVKKQVSSVHGYDMDQLFESHVTGDGIALFLDGLDEVSGEIYPKIAKALRALSDILDNLSSKNAVLITMRTQFHQQVSSELDDLFPLAYYVQPFSPANIYEFLSRWPHFEQSRRSEEILRIASDLTDRPTVREMCTNPLVLSMYVSNDQSGSETSVVETRTAFYSQVVEELLVARRGRQLGLQARSLLLDQRETLLGRLAFDNMQDTNQAANSLSWDAAVAGVRDLMPELSRHEAEIKLRDIAKETGIISEERIGETFRFIHLTFCEFFAAKEAAVGRDDGWDELIRSHTLLSRSSHPQTRTRLVEVVPFAIAMLPRARRHQAMLSVSSLDDAQVLGRCFLETQAYAHEAWDEYFAAESSSLVHTSPRDWDEGWLLRLHLFNVILKDRERWAAAYGNRSKAALETLFESLVRSDRDRLALIFSSYASVDAPAAFRLAKEVGVDLIDEQPKLVMQNLSDPAFLGLLVGQFNSSPGYMEKLALICAEAGLSQTGVAWSLALQDAPEGLQAAIADIPKKSRWFVGSRSRSRSNSLGGLIFESQENLRPSLYTYCLTYVYHVRTLWEDPQIFRQVNILRRVPAPARFISATAYYCLAGAIMAAIATAGFILIPDTPISEAGPGQIVVAAMSVPIVPPLVAMVFRWPGVRTELYGELINVDVLSLYREGRLQWWRRILSGYYTVRVFLPDALRARDQLSSGGASGKW